MNLEPGVFDRTRLITNILLIVLVAGNIYFAVQYIQVLKSQQQQEQAVSDAATKKAQITKFNKFFIDTILTSNGNVAPDDRIKLENDIHQIKDQDLIRSWNNFVASKDSKEAQVNAVKLISLLANKMI